jgi:SAM-dependent methyltransferase
METVRKPLQGVGNIVRFNWHFYAVALACGLGLSVVWWVAPPAWQLYVAGLLGLLLLPVVVSLAVSAYVYDFSRLYDLAWLPALGPKQPNILTVNAGFDEISAAIQQKYWPCEMRAVDFYDPARHTEVSIKRARRAYPPFPGTVRVDTRSALPLADNSADLIFAFLAAHEIRDATERANFFGELRRVVKPAGRIIVTEHLRDTANFLAYTIGFLHFHSRRAWRRTFQRAGLAVEREMPTTPFITTFVLQKNGSAA